MDAVINVTEGATVGWISSGEWMNYTVNVKEAGLYTISFRYASGNSAGGGPFHFELDGEVISSPVKVSSTNGWDKWATKTVNNIPLKKGEHILRIVFASGEFNLGKMTFTYSAPLPYNQPVANAGANVTVLMPETTATLNGTQSTNPGAETLTFHWEQIYGPSVILFSDANSATPLLSGLTEGIYNVKLTVSNGSYSDSDELFVIVSTNSNISPSVSIISPGDRAEFIAGKKVSILAEASDLDGSIEKVDFFEGENLIGTSLNAPYSIQWTSGIGEYSITAVATDNTGASTTSHATKIVLTPAPSCEGVAHNGDFKYRFSDDTKNPTITFIPSVSGVGSPTCIFYYDTSVSGSFPGYNVKPNTPFRITAEEGKTIYFYYTYSYPGQGEKNTANKPSSYVIGSCAIPTGVNEVARKKVLLYPNPTTGILNISGLEMEEELLNIYNLTGVLVKSQMVNSNHSQINIENLNQGIYIVQCGDVLQRVVLIK